MTKLMTDPFARVGELSWGLSRRLPRWRAFDGRQSDVAPSWATAYEQIDKGKTPVSRKRR
jgi:hypothetical protein